MRRRDFITVLAGATGYPHLAGAQQKSVPVIGFLNAASPATAAPFVAAFRQGLGETGYVEGKTWRSNTAGRRVTMIAFPH